MLDWFVSNFTSIKIATQDYHELLAFREIDAIYCAVPHNLHEKLYQDIILSGKHLLGEKPFGINAEANAAILAAVQANPSVLVRCSSEMPYFPGAQKIANLARERKFGTILEVKAGLLHSSDLDPRKQINWKRKIATNGAYGCLGDLGMHVVHLPFRLGWFPANVRALFSKIITERPGKNGELESCETWDNASLFTEVRNEAGNFPMLLETKRIAPGETNTWYIRVLGTELSAEFSTKFPKTLKFLPYKPGDEQAWRSVELGSQSVYPTITGGIFEFGFSDAIVQMWAAFCDELVHGKDMRGSFGCATAEETQLSHQLFSAALTSHSACQVVSL
jgi:predicted dehydrogenase